MQYFRSSVYFVCMVISAIVFASLALFTFPFSFETRYRFISQWGHFNIWVLKLTCGLSYEIEGLENLPPPGRPMRCNVFCHRKPGC